MVGSIIHDHNLPNYVNLTVICILDWPARCMLSLHVMLGHNYIVSTVLLARKIPERWDNGGLSKLGYTKRLMYNGRYGTTEHSRTAMSASSMRHGI